MAKDDDGKKRGPGRPPGDCNAKELAARRANPLKTGEHAKTFLGQHFRPCKRSACHLGENGYPCEAKRLATEKGQGLQACVIDVATNSDLSETVARSLKDGDSSLLSGVYAEGIADLFELHKRTRMDLLANGPTLQIPLVSKDGDHLGEKPMPNPAGKLLKDLSELTGMDVRQHGLTPKSQAEKRVDEGMGSFFVWAEEMQALEASGDEDLDP